MALAGEEESSIYARQRDGRFGMIFNRITWGAPYDTLYELNARPLACRDYRAQGQSGQAAGLIKRLARF